MFYQIFLSPQVKPIVIISNKLVCASCRTTYELGTKKIRIVQYNVKTSWNYNQMPIPLPPPKKKKLLPILAKDSLKIEAEPFPQCAILHEYLSFSQIFCP